MFKHYFEGIENIEVGPTIGLVLFLGFFIVLIYRVVTTDSGFISEMENKPLEDGTIKDEETPNSTQT